MSQARGATPARRKNPLARWLIAGLVSLVLLVALCSVSMTLGRYEMTHGIPNPWWGIFNGAYSYTPEQGPPSPELMVTRPETIIARYLSDYIDLAGASPCMEDPTHYDTRDDPVLHSGACDVKRSVADYQIAKVEVQRRGPQSGFMTIVSSVIHYVDGTEQTHQFSLEADTWDMYWLSFIHLNCWSSVDTLFFFGPVVPVSDIPTGASYASRARCKT